MISQTSPFYNWQMSVKITDEMANYVNPDQIVLSGVVSFRFTLFAQVYQPRYSHFVKPDLGPKC